MMQKLSKRNGDDMGKESIPKLQKIITINPVVRVAVAVVIVTRHTVTQEKCIYAGFRINTHGHGTLSLPGGHLEMYESWQQCAAREVQEEMDLNYSTNLIEYLHVINCIDCAAEKHYVTIFVMINTSDMSICSPPTNMEPEKCRGWNNYTWRELENILDNDPDSLFLSMQKLIKDKPAALLKALDMQ